MLRLQDPYKEGDWFTFQFRGSEIQLKVRPLNAEVVDKLRKKHKRVVRERDPQTKQLVTRDEYDDEAISEEMIDHALEDFKGIGDAEGNPLIVNRTSKVAVMNIPALGGDKSIAEFVFDKANELSVIVEEEKRVAIKNL